MPYSPSLAVILPVSQPNSPLIVSPCFQTYLPSLYYSLSFFVVQYLSADCRAQAFKAYWQHRLTLLRIASL